MTEVEDTAEADVVVFLEEDSWSIVELPPEPEPKPEPVEEPLPAAATRLARHSLDPLADPPPRRRFGRATDEPAPSVEVPARPQGPRLPPGQARREE